MNYKEEYNRWVKSDGIDKKLLSELCSIQDEKEIEDRFYKNLEFGTAGLRGIIGAGTNRMNIYTVRQATKGLADYIKTIDGGKERGVVIAYDSRIKSDEFAKEAALVLCQNGIKVYLFDKLHPVPMLSFSVKYLKCIAGIVITASHNPPEYNGYKVYWQDGGQTTPDRCKAISDLIFANDPLFVVSMKEENALSAGLLNYIGDEIDSAYFDYTCSLSVQKELTQAQKQAISLVYSPLHGSGFVPVTSILSKMGYTNLSVVEEQKMPNGKFPTVKVPNPEMPESFTLALKLAKEKDADLVFATDPDSDRLGVCIKDRNGEYVQLSGNQIGSLFVHYILSSLKEQDKLSDNAYIVQSIVSTGCTKKIADSFGVQTRMVLTGFRYIAEQIEIGGGDFLFGYEESYGFLTGTKVRDKDACLASLLICEACAYYKSKGKSLVQVFDEMDNIYGAFAESGKSFTVSGKDGMEKIAGFMENLHNNIPKELDGEKVTFVQDYKTSVEIDILNGTQKRIDLPKSDVLCFDMGDSLRVCIRPSGTEPKLKLYFGVSAQNRDAANKRLKKLSESVISMVEKELM